MVDDVSDPISFARLSELIGLIYECAIDPSCWPTALEAIRVELGGANSSLDLIAIEDARVLLNVTTNIPPPYRDTIREYAADVIDDWGGRERMQALPLDEPGTILRQNPGFAHVDNRHMREWVRPQGLGDVLGIWLARDAATFGFVGFGRLTKDGPFGERELAIARLLVPHLQRVATINRLLDVQAFERSTFVALIDTLRSPVFLVTRDLRLAHVNRSGQALLSDQTALYERRGHLGARDPGTAGALAAAVAQASQDRADLARKGLGIPLLRGDGAIGALHVLPLDAQGDGGRHAPLSAVFVAESHAPLVAPGEVFAALFGLTAAERRIFDHVVAGRSIAQIADALEVERSTVKTHLLRIYDKTGVRRQAELVHIAASLSPPIG